MHLEIFLFFSIWFIIMCVWCVYMSVAACHSVLEARGQIMGVSAFLHSRSLDCTRLVRHVQPSTGPSTCFCSGGVVSGLVWFGRVLSSPS